MSASLHVPENADIAERVLMPGDPLRAIHISNKDGQNLLGIMSS